MSTATPGALATTFDALGTRVHVGTRAEADLGPTTYAVRDVLAAVDVSCSRFRADSELVAANARAGHRVPAGPVLVAAVEAALRAAEETDGLVNPLLGRVMVALGYDRTFARLRPTDPARVLPAPDPDAWRRLEVGPDWVRVPAGTALDLGSIGKAWSADLAAGTVTAQLGLEAVVSVGGDLVIAGGGTWPVEVREHPGHGPARVVHVTGGGVATSSTQVRRWTRGGAELHHVLDPRTGRPVEGAWRTVTATGPTCAAANTAATAAIVLGAQALGWLEQRGVDARLVAADGSVAYAGRWPRDEVAA